RSGRAQEAIADLAGDVNPEPLNLEVPVDFHRFTLVPRTPKRIFADEFLGRFRDVETVRLVLIDAHILRSDRDARALEAFLSGIRPARECEVRIKVARPRQDRERGRYDFSEPQQNQRVEQIRAETHARGIDLIVHRPNSVLEEHDRIILWHTRTPTHDSWHRVLLGQGLVGFEGWCDRRSEGVYFQIPAPEFEAIWKEITANK
ncbi:MAG: hypothetical protein K1X57_21895, partial [Gemmataceae bacterium]|nr:hypothetical protein [Gemmataceae bacterium]